MSEPIAILNGRIVPVSQAAISVFDTGFVHGAAVGDMVRTFKHVPFRLEDHLDRLQRGIDALQIASAPPTADWQSAIDQVVSHNAGLISRGNDLGIILFATAGWNPTYLPSDADCPPSTWGVHTFDLPFERWAGRMQHGQELVIPATPQIPAHCLDPTIKWRSRLPWYLADQSVRQQHPHASALFLDGDGSLCETSTANIFVVQDGSVRTPRAEKTLDGISRRVVFELASELGIPCEFAHLMPDDALRADEAFTSSTPYCLMPISKIDGQQIGGQIPGPVFERLIDAWSEETGVDVVAQIAGQH